MDNEDYLKEKSKTYEINIINKKKTIKILKKFFKKYYFEQKTSFAELKKGATTDDGQVYQRTRELFIGCKAFYKFKGNSLIIIIDNLTMPMCSIPLNKKNVRLIDNLVIDIKKANGYDIKKLPEKPDISDIDSRKSLFELIKALFKKKKTNK